MGPRGRPSLTRAKNFKLSIWKLAKYSKKQIGLIVLAVLLTIGSTICTLIGPNKLKDLTNLIYAALTPNGTLDMSAVARIGVFLAIIYVLVQFLDFFKGCL